MTNRQPRNETYDALVTRAVDGRMGTKVTLGDLSRGLLGEEGTSRVERIRAAMSKAGIPYDVTYTVDDIF